MRSSTPRPRTVRAGLVLALAVGLLIPAVAGAAGAQAADLPPGPSAPAPAPNPVDAYVPYDRQSTCDPTDKPGARYLGQLVLAHYRQGRISGISRDCSVGGSSEHKEGRALDWAVNVNNAAQKAAGDAFTHWLTAPGPDGRPGWNARRLGVMYVIWDGRIFSNSSASAQWRPYTGSSPHTDHVHVSLSWNGAWQRSSWWTGVAIPEQGPTQRYVGQVYQDLFGRAVDGAGLRTWTEKLTSGTPRGAVANSITASAEYRSGLIRGAYQEFLGRSPDGAGLAGWLDAMNRGMTIQSMESGFLASPEYYLQAGNDDARWVERLYGHVLGRSPGAQEVQHWLGQIGAGSSRQGVAMGFLLSTERLSTVIDGYYQHLLGRGIDPTGRRHWVTAVQTGTRTEQIIGGIVASDEYYTKAQR